MRREATSQVWPDVDGAAIDSRFLGLLVLVEFQAQMDSGHDVGLSHNGGIRYRRHRSAVTGVFPSGMSINMR